MKNITVSVDGTVHRRAQLRAAELNTSLSALVKGFLEELTGDASESERRRRLQNELLERLDAEGRGVIAGQRPDRKALHAQSRPGSSAEARMLIDCWGRFTVQPTTWEVLQRALDLRAMHPLSYWDAAILAAAEQSGCTLLLSEDLSDGGQYGAVEVRNPFRRLG